MELASGVLLNNILNNNDFIPCIQSFPFQMKEEANGLFQVEMIWARSADILAPSDQIRLQDFI